MEAGLNAFARVQSQRRSEAAFRMGLLCTSALLSPLVVALLVFHAGPEASVLDIAERLITLLCMGNWMFRSFMLSVVALTNLEGRIAS